MALTERQQEIQDLVRQGKSAKEIAEALGISENAVYQHRRRIRSGGGSTGNARTQARSTGRQSSDSTPAADGDAPKPAPQKAVTPERALRDEKTDLERQVKDFDADVVTAEKALESARQKRDAGVAKINDRLNAVTAALAALTGNVTPAPAQPTEAPAAPVAAPENGQEAAQPPQDAPVADTAKDEAAETPKAETPKRSGSRRSGAKAATNGTKDAAEDAAPADDASTKAEADAAQAAAEAPADPEAVPA